MFASFVFAAFAPEAYPGWGPSLLLLGEAFPRGPDEEGGDGGAGPHLRVLGKSFNANDEDPMRVARAEGSRGYKAAREMVYEAITLRATDIHMEPTREEMHVRFRIDGILQPSDP